MTALPSRRYTCAECGRKGRRNNSPDERLRAPVCPSCERQCPRCQKLETALAYSAEGQTLLSKFLQAVKDRDEARALAILLAEAIVSTLEENRHLADGENCTLAKLKTVVPHWK